MDFKWHFSFLTSKKRLGYGMDVCSNRFRFLWPIVSWLKKVLTSAFSWCFIVHDVSSARLSWLVKRAFLNTRSHDVTKRSFCISLAWKLHMCSILCNTCFTRIPLVIFLRSGVGRRTPRGRCKRWSATAVRCDACSWEAATWSPGPRITPSSCGSWLWRTTGREWCVSRLFSVIPASCVAFRWENNIIDQLSHFQLPHLGDWRDVLLFFY